MKQGFKQNNTIFCLFLINAGRRNLTFAKPFVPYGIVEMISESNLPLQFGESNLNFKNVVY
jgi:hypothetical protein